MITNDARIQRHRDTGGLWHRSVFWYPTVMHRQLTRDAAALAAVFAEAGPTIAAAANGGHDDPAGHILRSILAPKEEAKRIASYVPRWRLAWHSSRLRLESQPNSRSRPDHTADTLRHLTATSMRDEVKGMLKADGELRATAPS